MKLFDPYDVDIIYEYDCLIIYIIYLHYSSYINQMYISMRKV